MAADDDALALARKLAALPEPQMRQRVLAETLAEKAADWAATVLGEIVDRGRSGGPPFNIALRALVGVLSDSGLSYEAEAAIYHHAKDNGHAGLMQMFYSGAGGDPVERRTAEPQRELTLGHRKSLARSTDPDTLQRLMLDPEPPVIANLLQNPRVTEDDVVRLAARRPTDPQVQRTISASARWNGRYRIKRALVLNPHTPVDVSLRLLGFLAPADLKLLTSSSNLPPSLQQAAERMMRGR